MEEEEEAAAAAATTRNKLNLTVEILILSFIYNLYCFQVARNSIQMALSSEPNRHRRTHSDGPISTSLNRPVKPPPPLQIKTIPSRKYSLNIIQPSQLNLADMDTMKRRKPPKSPLRRSKSELELEELEELKGLKICDSEEVERDIVPGLRKKRSEVKVKPKTRRYSSDWRPIDEEERKRVLGDWSVLANGDERDVKDQLQKWAHVVASSRLFAE